MNTDDENFIIDNINLAYDTAWKYYNKFQHKIDIEELQSLCLLGLTKASKSYNSELEFTFSTYACKCMINEILLYYRQNKKYLLDISIYTEVGDNIELHDTFSSDFILDDYIENNDNIKRLYKYINKLDERHKTIILLKLKGLTMNDIADKLGISQRQVSRDYNKAINILRNYLL